ncbi:hypothetical protein HanPSC8_Chr16g0699271 [Helianthus annuus]|nr:hypothetical protein HanPSC8_Chr16g0699271 [Helianthus annuus]
MWLFCIFDDLIHMCVEKGRKEGRSEMRLGRIYTWNLKSANGYHEEGDMI